MSFNVRYGAANDEENSWPHRRELLVETVKMSDPDVLGLQECLSFQAAYLQEALREYRYIGLGRDRDGDGEMTAIFYKTKSLLPLESGHLWLSEHPDVPGSVSWDSSLTRMATWIKFRHWESGTVFYAANTHFDHRGEAARLESAYLLRRVLPEHADGAPLLLTGDFNALGGSSGPWKAFHEGGFLDAWEVAAEREGPVATWSGFKAPRSDSDRRIDWILTHGAVRVSRCATITHSAGGRYPSDHFPVLAEVHLGEK